MTSDERKDFLELMKEVRGKTYTRGWLEGHFLYPSSHRKAEEKMVQDTLKELLHEKAKGG